MQLKNLCQAKKKREKKKERKKEKPKQITISSQTFIRLHHLEGSCSSISQLGRVLVMETLLCPLHRKQSPIPAIVTGTHYRKDFPVFVQIAVKVSKGHDPDPWLTTTAAVCVL